MLDKKVLSRQITSRRTFIIGAGKLGLLFLLAGRLFYMQFLKKDEYKTLSDKNRIRIVILPPARGQIYDVNKELIAKNNSCFRLLLDKNVNTNRSEEISLISKLLELDDEQVKEVKKKLARSGRKVPTMIIDCLDWKQVSIIEEQKVTLKSIFVDIGYERFYKYGKSIAHLLGYMGRRTNQKSDLSDTDFKVGVSGIERYYETLLKGDVGYKKIEVNARGKYVRILDTRQSTTGEDLHLTIDAQLQQKVMPLLSPKGCSAIVMDCTNGAILTSNSSPVFEPNNFNKLSSKYWSSLLNNPHKPLIDKTIKSLYPPGSIFKIITILAALEAGVNPDHKVLCTGKPVLGGNYFRCSRLRGHGKLNMNDAIKHSCNSYIYEIAKITGADKIIAMAKKFGFGEHTGIDLSGEYKGFVPTKEWKQEKYGTKWTIGDTLNLSIGQGFLLSTPMQLARLIAAIASSGKLFTPQIIESPNPKFTQLNIKQEHLNILKKALYETINVSGGTGHLARINYKGIRMAGKTGTAQVIAKKHAGDNLSRADIAWNNRNHAIFSGYAPFNNPKYAILVYFDHGGGGGRNAAPIARKIMQYVLEKYT